MATKNQTMKDQIQNAKNTMVREQTGFAKHAIKMKTVTLDILFFVLQHV